MPLSTVSDLRRFSLSAAVSMALFFSPLASSALQPLEDDELDVVTGQSFIQLNETSSSARHDFVQLKLGLEVNTQVNIDKLSLGKWDRYFQGDPRVEGAVGAASRSDNFSGIIPDTDIDIDNLSLGVVDPDTGKVFPFYIKDPYLEFAYDKNTGDLDGFRLGFGEARGVLAGNVNSLTGNVPARIYASGRQVKAGCEGIGKLTCLFLKPKDVYFADVGFVSGVDQGKGQTVSKRATHIGLKNGQTLKCAPDGGCTGLTIGDKLQSSGCSVSLAGLTTCFPLSNYGGFPIGNLRTLGEANDNASANAAKGVFLSLSSSDISWNDLDNPGEAVNAFVGAFLNVPVVPASTDSDGVNIPEAPAISLDFAAALAGISRTGNGGRIPGDVNNNINIPINSSFPRKLWGKYIDTCLNGQYAGC